MTGSGDEREALGNHVLSVLQLFTEPFAGEQAIFHGGQSAE